MQYVVMSQVEGLYKVDGATQPFGTCCRINDVSQPNGLFVLTRYGTDEAVTQCRNGSDAVTRREM